MEVGSLYSLYIIIKISGYNFASEGCIPITKAPGVSRLVVLMTDC